MTRRLGVLLAVLLILGGCARDVTGTPTWPGARLEAALLTADDFPPGVQYDRVRRDGGTGDGEGGPPAMLSDPPGCSDGLTRVIAGKAERGPGSAAEYIAAYDGARIVVTVLTWHLDLEVLAATAERCAYYGTSFDRSAPRIPVTTTRLDSDRPDALVYRQTMRLGSTDNHVYFSFENVDSMAVYSVAFPTPNPTIPVKGVLPQTFLDVIDKQATRIEAL